MKVLTRHKSKKLLIIFVSIIVFMYSWHYYFQKKLLKRTNEVDTFTLNDDCRFFYYQNKENNTVIGLTNKYNTNIIQLEFNKEILIKTYIYANKEYKMFYGKDFLSPIVDSSPFTTILQKSSNEGKIIFLKTENFLIINELIILLTSNAGDAQVTITYNKEGITENDFMESSEFSYHISWTNGKIKRINYYVKSTEPFRYVFYDQNGDGVIDYVTTLEKQNDKTHKILNTKTRDEFIQKAQYMKE